MNRKTTSLGRLMLNGCKPSATKTSDTIPATTLTLVNEPDGYEHRPDDSVSVPIISNGAIVATLLVNNKSLVTQTGCHDVCAVVPLPDNAKPALIAFSYDGFAAWMADRNLRSVHDAGFGPALIKSVTLG